VINAAVVGIPDDRWGETPVVVAVARDGSPVAAVELLAYCRAELTSFKRPSGAAVVERLPVTGIGKLAKSELRESILRGELKLVRSA
jgi:acyl-CoA synthetase (AMP-forming)/AMP-acid ligase II